MVLASGATLVLGTLVAAAEIVEAIDTSELATAGAVEEAAATAGDAADWAALLTATTAGATELGVFAAGAAATGILLSFLGAATGATAASLSDSDSLSDESGGRATAAKGRRVVATGAVTAATCAALLLEARNQGAIGAGG